MYGKGERTRKANGEKKSVRWTVFRRLRRSDSDDGRGREVIDEADSDPPCLHHNLSENSCTADVFGHFYAFFLA